MFSLLFQTGNTPISIASENNHLQIVKLLVKNNADINQVDNVSNI